MTARGARCSWIDLHAHILPGIDDGAADLEQAVEMARMAQEDGIGQLVATPHSADWPAENQRLLVERATDRLNAALQAAGVQLTVLPGVEAYLDNTICEQVKREQVFPLADTRYILVELPASAYPLYTDQAIFELQVMGLSVILAHPERNAQLQRKLERLVPLVERGVLMQLTAASIVGQFGAGIQKTAYTMLRSRLAHLIASDAHDDHHRPPILSEAVAVAGGIVGEEEALAMVSGRPRAILNDEPLELESPALAHEEQRTFWARWWPRR